LRVFAVTGDGPAPRQEQVPYSPLTPGWPDDPVAAILEQGRPARPPRGAGAETKSTPAAESAPFLDWMPAPRAAAAAILGILGFGVLVGSLVGGGVASLVSAPLLLVSPGSAQHASTVASSGGGGSGGGGNAGGSDGSGSRGGGGSSASGAPSLPVALQALTV
jgi:uncharacterized membrane protein YgcG